jgi:FKBP-type peptidyl-prolyl cis-trans isomerase
MMKALVFALISLNLCSGDQISYMKRVGKKFLDEKAKEPDVITLKSGMLVKILKEGTDVNAKSPRADSSCDVTYSGTLKDGTKFDAGTTSFAPNQVIKVRH